MFTKNIDSVDSNVVQRLEALFKGLKHQFSQGVSSDLEVQYMAFLEAVDAHLDRSILRLLVEIKTIASIPNRPSQPSAHRFN